MIDTKELRRLVQAALAAPGSLSHEWMDRLGQFQEAADPSVVSELLDRLEAAEKERNVLKAKVERIEKRLRLILEEPENTMSNSKAMREMLRQARLALKESK